MAYKKQNFTNGEKLTASHLNYMEDGIYESYNIVGKDTNIYLVKEEVLANGENNFTFDIIDCKSIKIENNSNAAGYFRIQAYDNKEMTSLAYDKTILINANSVLDTKDLADLANKIRGIKVDNRNGLSNAMITIYIDHRKDGQIYRVEKNGSGDFTKLSDAIKEATRYFDSIVYVGQGTYDIIDELGSEYIETISVGNRGLYLKNRVHLIFASDSKVTCNYTGTTEAVQTWLTIFNSGIYGFTLENATLEASNCRYTVHDERDSDSEAYTNKYINCNMYMDNTARNITNELCIGGGLGVNGHIIIDGCKFSNKQNESGSASYHNSAGVGKSRIDLRDSYFDGKTFFYLSEYGESSDVSIAYISGCSFGAEVNINSQVIDVTDCNIKSGNVGIVAWNNVVRKE